MVVGLSVSEYTPANSSLGLLGFMAFMFMTFFSFTRVTDCYFEAS